MPPTLQPAARPHYSIPSILAIVAAIGSFVTGAGFGMLLAIAAIVLGAIGFLLAIMPSVRGGVVSILSIALGAIGIIAAIIKLVAHAV